MGLLGLGRSGAQRRFLARFGRNGGRGQGGGGRGPVLFPRRHQSCLPTVFQPIALSPNVDGRRVMQQSIQNGGRDDRVSEDRTPVPVALVRSQDDAASFVPCTHQLEENRGPQIIQRQVTDFVDHQNFPRQINVPPAVPP